MKNLILLGYLVVSSLSMPAHATSSYFETWTSQEDSAHLTVDPPGTGELKVFGGFEMHPTAGPSKFCASKDTTARDALSPEESDCVYHTNNAQYEYWDGDSWEALGGSGGGGGLQLWVTGFSYEVDDFVVESDIIYRALTNHTSGTFATDLANGDWTEVSGNPFDQDLSTTDAVEFAGVTDSTLTAGRVALVGTGGALDDDGEFTYDQTTNAATISNGQLNVDNLRLDGNTLSSENSNGNIVLNPNGTGQVNLPDLTASRVLKTDASSNVTTGQVNLASTNEVTGILPQANGGTGADLSGAATGGLLYDNGSAFAATAAGTSGRAVLWGGAGAPTEFNPTAGRVIIAGTSGIMDSDSGLTFNGTTDTLTAGALRASSTTALSAPWSVGNTTARTSAEASAAEGDAFYDTELHTLFTWDDTNNRWVVNGVQPAIYASEACTAAAAGWTGANVTITCRKTKIGQWAMYEMKAALAGGAPTGTTLTFDLPTADVIDTSLMTNTQAGGSPSLKLGTGTYIDSGNNSYPAWVSYVDTNTVGVKIMGTGSTYGNTSDASATVPITAGDGDNVDIRFWVPIVGQAPAFSTYSIPANDGANIRWTDVVNCLTVTTGSVANANNSNCTFASTASTRTSNVIAPTNSGDIALKVASATAGKYYVSFSGLVRASTSGTVCAFQLYDGTTTIGPYIIRYSGGDEQPLAMNGVATYAQDQTNLEWRVRVARSSGTGDCNVDGQSSNRTISISLVPITRMITATFKDVVTSPGTSSGSPKMYSFQFSGAGSYDAVCSSTPCTIRSVVGTTPTSVTRGGTGVYTVTFPASTWTSASTYNCVTKLNAHSSGNVATLMESATDRTATTITFEGLYISSAPASGNTDVAADVICHGY